MFSHMCISVFRTVYVASPFSQDLLELQSCLSKWNPLQVVVIHELSKYTYIFGWYIE